MSEMSLGDSIRASIAQLSAEEEPEGVAAPQAQLGAEPAAETAPVEAPEPAAEGAQASQQRDASGKFAKAPEAVQAAPPETAQTGEPAPPEGETSRPPPGLPAPLKAAWKDLPAEWRQAFVKQEDSFKIVRDEWGPKAERLNRLDEILAPRRERLALNGVSEIQWIQSLAAAEQMLETNPVQAFQALAQRYGVDLRQVVGQPPGPQGMQPQPYLPPELQGLPEKVATLEQTVAQQREREAGAQQATVQAHIDAFANDPAYLYFENVKPQIAVLMRAAAEADQPLSLKDAYDQACWADPQIRGILLKEQAAEAARQAQAAQPRAKASLAAQAAGSVTGAPGAGGIPPGGADPSNLRETIRAAYQEQSGSV